MAEAGRLLPKSIDRSLEKAEGALIALAAGDALGWPQEVRAKEINSGKAIAPSTTFRSWKRRGGGRYFPHEELVNPGEYSDDTQLTIAVARARLIGGDLWGGGFLASETAALG